jgi:hypothetical protein
MGSRGRTKRRTGVERGGASGDARAETREDEFDVNRSIVIRVNRLPLFVDGPRRPAEHNPRFVLLYFIPRVVEEHRALLRRAASIYSRLPREAAIAAPLLATKRET